MSSETPSQITTSGRIVRLFVGGLPLGLVIMGALSFVFYFNKKNRPEAPPSEFAAIMRRELNSTDFNRYVEILSKTIGERSLRQPENLQAAAAFMESSMGPDNMGHGVIRQEFTAEGKTLANLLVILTGSKEPDEAVVVLAAHDSSEANLREDSAGAAAMLSLAHSMAGDPQACTVVFLSVANVQATRDDANGCWQASQHAALRDLKIREIIALAPGPEGGRTFALPAAWRALPLSTRQIDLQNPMGDLESLSAAVKSAAK
jgi:hypothetical protein